MSITHNFSLSNPPPRLFLLNIHVVLCGPQSKELEAGYSENGGDLMLECG